MSFLKPRGPYAANNALRFSVGLDQSSTDRLTYAQHLIKHLFGIRAGTSVLVRAALWHYVALLSELLGIDKEDARLLRAELVITGAIAGDITALPREQLEAVPLRPFTEIEQEAFKARQAMLKARMWRDLRQYQDHDDE